MNCRWPALALLLMSGAGWAAGEAGVEETRLFRLEAVYPELAESAASLIEPLKAKLSLREPVELGLSLWQSAVASVGAGSGDDRPLYWARLALLAAARESGWTDAELVALERASRGFADVAYTAPAAPPGPGAPTRRILITGFDPFHLDERMGQSNPSGLAVLALDGVILKTSAGPARVEGALMPVRFADFDRGLVESFFEPLLAQAALDLVVTISMGRDAFDLERFPGRRRSSPVPDNVNVLTGATPERPLVPLLAGEPLPGPEFLEFSLPATAMIAVNEPFAVRDNRRVRTIERGEFEAESLKELAGLTAVAGSGGGYLSNEIAYRSLALRQRMGARVAMGHLHTPRVEGFDPVVGKQIQEQVRRLLVAAVESLTDQ